MNGGWRTTPAFSKERPTIDGLAPDLVVYSVYCSLSAPSDHGKLIAASIGPAGGFVTNELHQLAPLNLVLYMFGNTTTRLQDCQPPSSTSGLG